MNFFTQVTLYDIFLVALGLLIASIARIFYDSYRERKRLEELDELIAVYNESMNVYDEGIVIISENQEILFVNKEASRILGMNQDALSAVFLEKQVKIRIPESSKEQGLLSFLETDGGIPHAEMTIEQRMVPVALSSHTFHIKQTFSQNKSSWRIVTIQDISKKIKLQEKIESAEFSTDILTGLSVKYHLIRKLHTTLAQAAQNQHKAALGMFGISDYHYLQSKYGTGKIDILLKFIVKALGAELREHETLYRFDHDSLAMVFEEIEDENAAKERLLYLEKRIKDILMVEKVDTHIVSGLYMIQRPYPSADQAIDHCLNILYAKSVAQPRKKKKIIHTTGSTSVTAPERLGKRVFKDAIKNNDFFIFYQPIYALKNDTLIGVEVLSRLNHNREGLLMPEFFLGQAVACNMMTEVTAHLLDRVLSQKRFWSIQLNRDLDTTINLGLSDIHSEVFTETLEKKIIEYEINPAMITIDISEEILERDYEAVFEECYMLEKLGVKIAIDHFGKESVSLRHISTLPLHAIKMDGTVIEEIGEKEEKLRLASGIISLGRKLDLKVGATFVDSSTTKMLLDKIGCHFAQGNYLEKAVPAFEITSLIQEA